MKKFYIISFLTVLIIIAGFLFLKPEAQAVTSGGVTSPVSGTATITNMGYKIHFLGYDGGTSGNISYNVQYNSATGFSGYGWSPEYGWVQFNGTTATALSLVGGYPNRNDNEVPDWATGAISLKGTTGGTSVNIPYSVTFDPVTGNTNTVNHWAWGGNVIGWIDFSNVKIVPAGIIEGCAASHYFCIPTNDPTLSSNYHDSSITNLNGSITYTYTWDCSINGGADTESCSQTVTVPPPDCTEPEIANPDNPPCYCPNHPTDYNCKKKPAYKEN